MKDFTGSKIALINGDELLVIQRDNKPGLHFAGMWDLPGGGREDDETPAECAIREVEEELGIRLDPNTIIWQSTHPAIHDPNLTAYFLVAHISAGAIAAIKFGDEGQGWKMIKIADFMADPLVIDPLKNRLQVFLDGTGEKE